MHTIQHIIEKQKHQFTSSEVMRALIYAHKALGELKGVTYTLPNQNILLHTLALQEAKDSSAIENIVTTQDELYQSNSKKKKYPSIAAKEVYRYVDALQFGYNEIIKNDLLTNKTIITMQSIIEENEAGIRKQSGTTLKNESSNEIIYTPPQNYSDIITYMTELESFINTSTEYEDLDILLRLAIIHHQFESIHPFYDGNGRTGRIINVLYLVKEGLLDSPILYLSRYINQHKHEYYKLLQEVREDNAWSARSIFILTGISATANHTTNIIKAIKQLMLSHKHHIRNNFQKIYSQDLINNIFRHPYTKIEFLTHDLSCSRITAAKYLDMLASGRTPLLEKIKIGKENYYINKDLFELLTKI